MTPTRRTLSILCFVIIFMFISFLNGNAGNLNGKVHDKTNTNPLEFVNVVLLKADSSFVVGAISNEKGEFLIESIKNGSYILKVSFIGYNTFCENIFVNEIQNQEIINLEPSDVRLGEIVVIGQQPTFKLGTGGIIANVSLSNLKNVGTANDVIQRMPGIVFEDDKISVFGKGTPIIYINSRRINDQQELDRLLSEDISTVELITNPGAKYSADGRAVLIIKTKKKQNGFSALISEKLTLGSRLGDNENLNISYSNNNISIFASYNHNFRNIKTDDHTIFSTIKGDSIRDHYYHIVDRYPRNFHSATVGLDWSINTNHSIGTQYQYYITNAPKAISVSTDVNLFNGLALDTINTYDTTKDRPYQSLINAFYKGKFNENLSTQLDIDYLSNYTDRRSHTTEYSSSNSSEINIISKSDYQLWAGKLTMEHKSNIGTVEFGGEFNYINGNGSIIGQNTSHESSIYSSKEQKVATFLSYTNTFNEFNLVAGLRYEFNHDKSTDDVAQQNRVNRKYSELYPNLSISRKIKDIQLDLLFSKKVSRPSITELYNNTAYLNQFILQKGNPYLTKVDLYDVNLQANYKMFYFNIGYSYQKNPITFYSEPEANSSLIITTVANYDKFQEINATANFNHKISIWQPNYTMSITKPFFSAIYNNNLINYNNASFSLNAYNDFVLPKSFTLSANFTYMTNFQYMLINVGHYQKLDLGVRKLFLEDKLKLNLEIWDVFNWMKQNNSTKINSLTFIQRKKRESRFIVFTISYQFNNYKKKYSGSNAAKDDIGRF